MKKSMAAAVFLSALLLAGALSGCASQSEKTGSSAQSAAEGKKEGSASFRTVEEIRNSGVIRIGVFTDKAPFGYIDSKGENQGYDVFYARRIAEDLGVKAEFTSPERLTLLLRILRSQRRGRSRWILRFPI